MRTKEQGTHLTLNEHDDDDDEKGRLFTHFCMYTNIVDTPIEMDVLGLECGSLDFNELAQYRFQ